MRDIKYFFLNKNNQTIQRGQKIFREGQITENITEKYYFSKSIEVVALHGPIWIHPARAKTKTLFVPI
jgi:hypothetical protein